MTSLTTSRADELPYMLCVVTFGDSKLKINSIVFPNIYFICSEIRWTSTGTSQMPSLQRYSPLASSLILWPRMKTTNVSLLLIQYLYTSITLIPCPTVPVYKRDF